MFISATFARMIVNELLLRGVSHAELVRSLGMRQLAQMETAVGIRPGPFAELLALAMDETADPNLGLAIGTKVPLTALEVPGALMLASQTLRDALQVQRRTANLLVAGATWSLDDFAGQTTLRFSLAARGGCVTPRQRRFGVQLALALAARIVRYFAPDVSLSGVHFQHEEEASAEEYVRAFGNRPAFSQPWSMLSFPSSILDRQQPYYHPVLVAALTQLARDLLDGRHSEQPLTDRVRTLLLYEQRPAVVQISELAQRLGVSERVLRRRLAQEGKSFSSVVEEVMRARALEDLARPMANIRSVAFELGYSDPSPFHRAFKRWTGQTPSSYRRIALGHEGAPEMSSPDHIESRSD